MKSALKFVVTIAAVLLISAWAAPLLFKILPFEYERIMNRLIVFLGIGTIYAIYIRGHERELAFFGFSGADKFKWFGSGFVFGVLTIVFIVMLEVFLGTRQVHLNFPKSNAFISIGRALLTGLAVGIFEEWFFRGFLLKSFRRGLSLKWAIFWMNFLYALSHFIEVGNLKGGAQASFVNSLKLMLGFFSQFKEPVPVGMALIGLAIFGCLVTWALLKTGSLYMSMGIHAGVVAALKSHDRFIVPVGGPVWIFGDDKYYNGIFGWCCLFFSWFMLLKLISKLPWEKQTPALAFKNS